MVNYEYFEQRDTIKLNKRAIKYIFRTLGIRYCLSCDGWGRVEGPEWVYGPDGKTRQIIDCDECGGFGFVGGGGE